MLATVRNPENEGVGIAAPQVGILRRIVAVQRYSDTVFRAAMHNCSCTADAEDVGAEAGAEKADLVIAAAALDEVNLYTCLMAKAAGTTHTIARVRNPQLSLIHISCN